MRNYNEVLFWTPLKIKILILEFWYCSWIFWYCFKQDYYAIIITDWINKWIRNSRSIYNNNIPHVI